MLRYHSACSIFISPFATLPVQLAMKTSSNIRRRSAGASHSFSNIFGDALRELGVQSHLCVEKKRNKQLLFTTLQHAKPSKRSLPLPSPENLKIDNTPPSMSKLGYKTL